MNGAQGLGRDRGKLESPAHLNGGFPSPVAHRRHVGMWTRMLRASNFSREVRNPDLRMQHPEFLNTGKSFFKSQSWLDPCESKDRTEAAGVGEARSLEGWGGGGICTPEDEDTTGLDGVRGS